MSNLNKIIYGLSSAGKIKQWSATSDLQVNSNSGLEIIVTWGYFGDSYKKQNKSIFVTSGKNLNKANETTLEEQCIIKIEQLYTAQYDKGYSENIESLTAIPDNTIVAKVAIKKPQLATKFKDRSKFIKVDSSGVLTDKYYGQPKLNGSRMFVTKISDTELVFSSRSGKLFKTFTHFQQELLNILQVGDILDGEIFSYKIPFENIQSLVNSDSLDYTILDLAGNVQYRVTDLEYHVYDVILANTNKPFKDRLTDLLNIFNTNSFTTIKKVETILFNNFNEFKIKFAEYVELDYEGLMLRHENGPYKFGYRTTDLIKYKEMLQDEFEILDIYLAENDPTKVQVLCKNRFSVEEGYSEFDIGSILGNKEVNLDKYYKNKNELIGKYLTVNYQALSKYNVPLFPVGVDLRSGYINEDNEFVPEI